MRNDILTFILRVLEWVSRTFPRPPGRHSASFFEGGPAPAPASTAGPACQQPSLASGPLSPRVTGYGVLDGDAVRMIRPYVIAAERRREQAQQRMRRRALALAEMGIDYPEPLRGAPLDLPNVPANAEQGDEEFKVAMRRGVAALLAFDGVDCPEPRGASLAS
jgi:hypothetical protein